LQWLIRPKPQNLAIAMTMIRLSFGSWSSPVLGIIKYGKIRWRTFLQRTKGFCSS